MQGGGPQKIKASTSTFRASVWAVLQAKLIHFVRGFVVFLYNQLVEKQNKSSI